MLLDHDRRLGKLEGQFQSLEIKMGSVESGVHRVESTVLRESKTQTDLLNTLIGHHFEVKKAEHLSQTDLKKTDKMNKKEIIVAALGSIGILTGVVTSIYNLFQ